jgi:hypothetical protein
MQAAQMTTRLFALLTQTRPLTRAQQRHLTGTFSHKTTHSRTRLLPTTTSDANHKPYPLTQAPAFLATTISDVNHKPYPLTQAPALLSTTISDVNHKSYPPTHASAFLPTTTTNRYIQSQDSVAANLDPTAFSAPNTFNESRTDWMNTIWGLPLWSYYKDDGTDPKSMLKDGSGE